MQRLVECLKAIESSAIQNDKDDYLDVIDHPLVDEIQFISARLFISDEGSPLFDEMDRLQREHGYMIFPGERDGFGWVTACIQTKKGIIVFG